MSGVFELKTQSVATQHGNVSVTIAATTDANNSSGSSSSNPSSDEPDLLLLHGNSSCSRVFRHIISRPPPGVGRVIAMDYLGHGQSDDATRDPESAYTQGGYAEAAIAVLAALDVHRVVVLGWSLGGHVAIEMVPRMAASTTTTTSLRGIMIVGTPPVGNAVQVRVGFDPSAGEAAAERESRKGDEGRRDGSADVGLPNFPAAWEVWSEETYTTYPFASHGPPHEEWMVESARRTDGRSRKIMFEAMAGGAGCDQVGVVESSDIQCAVVNGADERIVNMDYIDGIKFKNLWEGQCYRIPDAGHTPFWERPDEFQKYLWRFVKDCTAS